MTLTTSPTLAQYAHDRIVGGAERGVRYRPDRPRSPYQVRIHPAPAENLADPLAAIGRRDELDAKRSAGETLKRARRTDDPTLEAAVDALLGEQRARRATGELRAKGLAHYENAARVWRTRDLDDAGEPLYAHDPDDPARTPLADLRLSELDPLAIGRWLRRTRRPQAPVAARNERQVLLKALEHAAVDGATVNPALRLIPTLERVRRDDTRRRTALDVDELELLVEYAPEYARRLVSIAGTVGFRIEELFTLTDDRVDLAAGTVSIPAELCKERRDKTIPLLPAELRIIREQLLARAPGTRLVFPKRQGGQWRHSHFYRFVWNPAKRRAAHAWREERRLGDDVATPFDGFKAHWLRRTATSLMRRAGLEPELVARRLGHDDAGELVLTVYRDVDEARELRDRLGELGDSLGAAVAARGGA